MVDATTPEIHFFEEIREKRKLTGELIQRGVQLFGKKLLKGLELAKDGKIRLITFQPSKRSVWEAGGSEAFYLVYPHLYCQCHSFHFAMHSETKPYCKHLIAQALAEQLTLFSRGEMLDDDLSTYLQEKLNAFKQ